MGMNTFGIFSSAIIAVVLSRPDHPSGHHHQVHHTQVHHSGPLHHSVHPVGHHSVHPAHHSAHPVVHHTTNQVHHSAPVVKSSPQTIAELVVGNPNFSTLLAAVTAADLVDTLSGEGPFTVFAPTTSAFEKVPSDALLLRHVVPGAALQGKNIPPGDTKLETAGGEEITVTRDNYIKIASSAGSAHVVLFDVLAINGVVHALNSVF